MNMPDEAKHTPAQSKQTADCESSESDADEETIKQYKVILLGNGATGKTSIAQRFANSTFATSYKQTLGLDFFMKRLQLPANTEVALQMWDIGGQSIGGKMIDNYIYGAHCVILCYDITNVDSFQDLEDWFRLVKKSFGTNKLPLVALMANKTDLNHMRVVKDGTAHRFAVENDMIEFGVSAKTGDAVNTSFYQIAAALSGVLLPKSELDSHNTVITAQITSHLQHDEEVEGGQVPEYVNKRGSCSIS